MRRVTAFSSHPLSTESAPRLRGSLERVVARVRRNLRLRAIQVAQLREELGQLQSLTRMERIAGDRGVQLLTRGAGVAQLAIRHSHQEARLAQLGLSLLRLAERV